MNRIVRLIIVASALCLLTACPNEEANRERTRAQQEQQAREAAEKQRQQAEAERDKAQKGQSTWQTVAMVFGIGVVVVLVFGTALGSSARKHAQKQKEQ